LASRHGTGDGWWPGEARPGRGGQRRSASLPEGGGRGQRGLARPAKGQGLVRGLAAVAQKKGRGSGPARVEGEAGGWAESGAGPEFKRNSFPLSIYF
jgi:hypothetical protein